MQDWGARTELFASRKHLYLAPMFPAQGPPLGHVIASGEEAANFHGSYWGTEYGPLYSFHATLT